MPSLNRILAGLLHCLLYAAMCMLGVFTCVVLFLVLWNAFLTIQQALELGR